LFNWPGVTYGKPASELLGSDPGPSNGNEDAAAVGTLSTTHSNALVHSLNVKNEDAAAVGTLSTTHSNALVHSLNVKNVVHSPRALGEEETCPPKQWKYA
jgi:hypothetical protein